jgi:PTH1 family peptidyl-tRNA hydrolase
MEFMNSSGISVSLAVSFYKIDLKDLVVIHDDVDLPFGEVRKQFASGSAGHKGVESIISNLGTKEFWRIRVGIGRPVDAQPVDEFVLRDFSEEELEQIKKIDSGSLI